MPKEVHQFHSGSSYGDAITNQMLGIRDFLRRAGYVSNIYVEHVDARLNGELKSLSQYRGRPDNVLIVHHSMGFDCFEQIVQLPDRKVLIYHNITPERFFADPGIHRYIRLGKAQLAKYRQHVVAAIADSNFNRRDMMAYGYRDVEVMPVQANLKEFTGWQVDRTLLQQLAGQTNLLFVGRVVPNKCHEDVIQSFAYYSSQHDPSAKLYLVGDLGFEHYVASLRALAEELGVGERVIFTGKVTKEALKAYYRAASLFLCMSEHEGFCVPLLEAMAMDLPVLAYRSSAVPETLGGAGILLDTKQPAVVGELIDVVLTDPDLKGRIVERQRRRLAQLEATQTGNILMSMLERLDDAQVKPSLQIQGPFDTSYSLAIVNRKLAEALDATSDFDVSLFSTEGPGDYTPQEKDLADKPLARALWQKSRGINYPSVTIRNMWPPRVADAKGMLNFEYFGWEESRVPPTIVAQFNRYLDGVGAMTAFVKQALLDSGATVPIEVTGVGVELPEDYPLLVPYPLDTTKRFRFLHISSGFPRKGIDVLLKGYFAAFSGADDVTLVIKTFPNPHQRVEAELLALRDSHPNPPEVIVLNQDLPERQLYSLYKAASCYVHVARGEGFGMPVAEAMLARVPVIVSPNTGLADFCSEETALLVPFEMVPAESHLTEQGSAWAEPDVEALAEQMRAMVHHPETLDLDARIERAHERVRTHYSWNAVASRWEAFIGRTLATKHRPKIAMVTSWNSKCGIAEYSRQLIEASSASYDFSIYANTGVELIEPESPGQVERCWKNCWEGGLDHLYELLVDSDADAVHLQFNFGYFDLEHVGRLIDRLDGQKPFVITFHSTKETTFGGRFFSLNLIRDSLKKASLLIVHQPEDVAILSGYGITENVLLLPIGSVEYPAHDKLALREELKIPWGPVVAMFGFLLPHKGVLETIRAVEQLREAYPRVHFLAVCSLHFDQVSRDFLQTCQAEVEARGLQNHVTFVTDYLELDESMLLLQASDLILLPYQPTNESASAALRFSMAAGRPLITTRQPIFAEVADSSHQIAACDPGLIAEGIRHVLESPALQQQLVSRMNERIEATSWAKVSREYVVRLHSVLNSPDVQEERRVPQAPRFEPSSHVR